MTNAPYFDFFVPTKSDIMKTENKIAKLIPLDSENLKPGNLYSGPYVIKFDGIVYGDTERDHDQIEQFLKLNTPKLKKGEFYTVIRVYYWR